jgi:hypothetical protein
MLSMLKDFHPQQCCCTKHLLVAQWCMPNLVLALLVLGKALLWLIYSPYNETHRLLVHASGAN